MFEDTHPADLMPQGPADPWAEFRVTQPREQLRLLRCLRDAGVPINLNVPGGSSLSCTLWTVDSTQGRLNFSADPAQPQLDHLVQADEAVGVAYLDSVKLQFDLQGFLLVRGAQATALQCGLPREVYRFQRRQAYRVRTKPRLAPTAQLRHPALPDMWLSLRLLDVSIGGCSLWLPPDVPPMQAGTQISVAQFALDAQTHFSAGITLQHVGAQGTGEAAAGVHLGCEWLGLGAEATRALQRWIDRSQQRHRLLTLD
jgi:flagellar brake protein